MLTRKIPGVKKAKIKLSRRSTPSFGDTSATVFAAAMESVAVAAPDASVTDFGEKLQVISEGRPLHEKTIDPVKLVDDVRSTLTETLAPAFSDSCELASAKEKSLPVPLNEIVCDAVSTESETTNVPFRPPAAVGEKTTVWLQTLAGCRVMPRQEEAPR